MACVARRETVRLVNRLHQWDVNRANKAPYAWGLETRVPFLDKNFLDLSMNLDPSAKMVLAATFCLLNKISCATHSLQDGLPCCWQINSRFVQIDMNEKPDGVHPKLEKWVLRKAFDTPEQPYLPEAVLWRQKEQFSDGVGYSWVDGLKAYAEVRACSNQCTVLFGLQLTSTQ